jgi:hypothetical protein
MLENPEYDSDLKLLVFERALYHNAGREPAAVNGGRAGLSEATYRCVVSPSPPASSR